MLGLVLANYLGSQIHDRTLRSSVEAADLTVRLGIEPHLTRDALAHGLPAAEAQALDDAVRGLAPGELHVARVQIWNQQRKIIYSTDSTLIGHGAEGEPSSELGEALKGKTASEVISNRGDVEIQNRALVRRFGDLLEVYTPIRAQSTGKPVGAFELYIPYAPVAGAIAHDTNRLYLVLVIGLTVLYGVLFRLVASASRDLRRSADELKEHADRSAHDACHDPLTALPNRSLFRDRAHQAILASARHGHNTALLLIDLDRFKEINDTLGHHSGDLLLREVGPRLHRVLRESDTVARFGGDEFGILLTHVSGPAAAEEVARAVHRALEEPFAIQGLTLDVEASIGIALHPLHASDFEELMQRADVAMYRAKAKRSGYEVYVPSEDESDATKLKLASELRQAPLRNELVMHYQPKADLRTGRIVGAEALMRWRHPRHGVMMPDRFIPLAERSGLIRSLTLFAARTALAQARTWREAGIELTVSVNLSTRDLIDVSLPDEIGALLEEARVPPHLLELEITESVIMADPMRARGVVARLREMGVKVAIDDFGLGYSSLGYLKNLPVNDLKIDKSFVINMMDDQGDAVIVQSTIDLAHNLGLTVIAEGVESDETWRRLRTLGCDVAQGWLIGRPLPAADFATWLNRGGFMPPAARWSAA
ncbi:MAG: putative bifunctional diguanylate cyclase/phosphodiesterase [Gaiellales bacterium]